MLSGSLIINVVVSKTNLKYLYWTFKQLLAHHTVNGCNMRTGDLCASGTISGPTKDSMGSMLEISWNGTQSVKLGSKERMFLQNGDSVIIKGTAKGKNYSIGFGECVGKIIE